MIGNKIASRIKKAWRISPQNDPEIIITEHDKEIPKERYISQRGIQKIIDDLRLM